VRMNSCGSGLSVSSRRIACSSSSSSSTLHLLKSFDVIVLLADHRAHEQLQQRAQRLKPANRLRQQQQHIAVAEM
jgi:hypothetical protein